MTRQISASLFLLFLALASALHKEKIQLTAEAVSKSKIPPTAVGGWFILNLKILRNLLTRGARRRGLRPSSRLHMKNPPTAVGGILLFDRVCSVGGLFILNLKILRNLLTRGAHRRGLRPPSRLRMKNPPTAVGGILLLDSLRRWWDFGFFVQSCRDAYLDQEALRS